jgi:hypothetical protein
MNPDETSGEKRQLARHKVRASLELQDGSIGESVNVSARGIYFVCAAAPAIGESLRFMLVLGRSEGAVTRVPCVGSVVRVDELAAGYGVAARIESYGDSEADASPRQSRPLSRTYSISS